MTAWRELYTKALQTINDENASSIGENLILTFCELILNLALIRSRTVMKTFDGGFLADSIVPGFTYVPIINVHSRVDDVSVIVAARSDGERLSRIGFNPTTAFEDLFRERDEIKEFYTIGETLFGLRPMPESDAQLSVFYIPYIEVNTLDEIIPLSDDYRMSLEILLMSLLWARLGHFDRASSLFEDGMGALVNVRNRVVRS